MTQTKYMFMNTCSDLISISSIYVYLYTYVEVQITCDVYVYSNQSGEGTGVELPSIFDEEEIEERDKQALTSSLGMNRSGRLRSQQQDFDKIDHSDSTGHKSGELNRIIGLFCYVCMYV
jgi:hypothetical protein